MKVTPHIDALHHTLLKDTLLALCVPGELKMKQKMRTMTMKLRLELVWTPMMMNLPEKGLMRKTVEHWLLTQTCWPTFSTNWGSVAATQQGPLGQRPHGAVWQQHSVWQEGWVSQSLDDYCPLSFLPIEWVIGSFRQVYTCCYLTLKQHRSCKIIFFKFPLLNHAGNHVWTNGCQHEAKSTSPAGNVFWKSTAWKRQVVQDVTMCPRSDMFKPNSGNKKLRMEAALTDIQEAKQVLWLSLSWSFHNLIYLESVYYFDVCFPCHVLIDLQKVNFSIRLTINVPTNPLNPFEATAGTDLVKKCVQGLVAGTTVDRLALVDAYGYDAFPALSTLEARLGSKHWAEPTPTLKTLHVSSLGLSRSTDKSFPLTTSDVKCRCLVIIWTGLILGRLNFIPHDTSNAIKVMMIQFYVSLRVSPSIWILSIA